MLNYNIVKNLLFTKNLMGDYVIVNEIIRYWEKKMVIIVVFIKGQLHEMHLN